MNFNREKKMNKSFRNERKYESNGQIRGLNKQIILFRWN